MLIKSKYKVARRVGAPIFEKTQTAKYAARAARRGEKVRKHPSKKTDYGLQMLEKQKARYTYLMNERQFGNIVEKAMASKVIKPADALYALLENRLGSVVYRMGLASTRLFAKQMVSHGHITIDGKTVTIPSYQVSIGEKIGIRGGSMKKKMFQGIEEKLKTYTCPSWIKFDLEKKEAIIQGTPKLEKGIAQFDVNAILEFYSR